MIGRYGDIEAAVGGPRRSRRQPHPFGRLLILLVQIAAIAGLACHPEPAIADNAPTRVPNLTDMVAGNIYIIKNPDESNTSVSVSNPNFAYMDHTTYGGGKQIAIKSLNGNVTYSNVATMRTDNIGYTTDGRALDLLVSIDKVSFSKLTTAASQLSNVAVFQFTQWYGPLAANSAGTYGLELTLTSKFVVHGTDRLLEGGEVDFLYWDLDILGPAGYEQAWAESIEKVSGYTADSTIRNDSTLAVSNSNRLFRATTRDNVEKPDCPSGVLLHAGSQSTMIWRGKGCSTGVGFDTRVTRYPEPAAPAKSPQLQVKNPGETVSFSISQTLPYVADTNKAQSITVSDVLDPAFDASGATLAVFAGDEDVSGKWSSSVSGQTVTFSARDCAHGGGAEGALSFRIGNVRLREGYDLSGYPDTSDGNRKRIDNKAATSVSGSSGNFRKSTNTVSVEVPIPVDVVYRYTGEVPDGAPACPVESASLFAGDAYDAKPGMTHPDGSYVFKGWYSDLACSAKWEDGTELPAGTTTLYGKWEPFSATIVVRKTDAGNPGRVLEGAVFEAVETSAGTRSSAASGADGRARIRVGKPGTYALSEKSAPAGYLVNEDWSASVVVSAADHGKEVAPEGALADCPDEKILASAKVRKVDSGDAGRVLEGAVFKIESLDGDGEWTATSGPDGVARFPDDVLVAGRYRLTEVSPPPRYRLNASWEVEFEIGPDDAGTTKDLGACPDDEIRGGAEVMKVDAGTGRGLAGAVFEIASLEAGSTKTWTMESSGEGGIARIENALPIGRYRVTELTPPVGYHLNTDWSWEFSISEGDDGEVVAAPRDRACPDTRWVFPTGIPLPGIWPASAAAAILVSASSALLLSRQRRGKRTSGIPTSSDS